MQRISCTTLVFISSVIFQNWTSWYSGILLQNHKIITCCANFKSCNYENKNKIVGIYCDFHTTVRIILNNHFTIICISWFEFIYNTGRSKTYHHQIPLSRPRSYRHSANPYFEPLRFELTIDLTSVNISSTTYSKFGKTSTMNFVRLNVIYNPWGNSSLWHRYHKSLHYRAFHRTAICHDVWHLIPSHMFGPSLYCYIYSWYNNI